MREFNRPSFATRFIGLGAIVFGGAAVYASFLPPNDDAFLLIGGLIFAIPGLIAMVRGY